MEALKAYSEAQIAKGLYLAQCWYEGWKFDEIDTKMLIEAIEAADKA